jgi:hypothetical protein
MEELLQLISELPVETRALLAELLLRSTPGVTAPSERSPVAITGIGCRFPGGANDPATFWKLLCEGIDAVGEVPPDRWDTNAFYDPDPAIPGRMCTRRGGFLKDVWGFDPGFFGISPREALTMDPQQRLLLEVGWRTAAPASSSGPRPATSRACFSAIGPRHFSDSTPTQRPEALPASLPIASPICSTCMDRAWLWTPPARRRWSRCTWPVRACGGANAIWRWREA